MTYIIASDNQMYQIPIGADADAVRQMIERRIANAANPKRKRPAQRRHSRHTSKREQAHRGQAALTGMAMANLIERVNTPQEIQND